jgi:hypothetical protein
MSLTLHWPPTFSPSPPPSKAKKEGEMDFRSRMFFFPSYQILLKYPNSSEGTNLFQKKTCQLFSSRRIKWGGGGF